MELFKILAAAFVTALAALLLKSTKPELSFAVTVVGTIVVLIFTFDMLKDSLELFEKLQEFSGISDVLIRQVLKIIAIGYLTEFSAGILNDFGSASVADKVVFAGKICILVLAAPIINSLMNVILKFMELV